MNPKLWLLGISIGVFMGLFLVEPTIKLIRFDILWIIFWLGICYIYIALDKKHRFDDNR